MEVKQKESLSLMQTSIGTGLNLIGSGPHCQMSHIEQLFLYSLIFALKPKNILEIGFKFGGSAAIILYALKTVGGQLTSLDPQPIPTNHLDKYENFSLIVGSSPHDIPDRPYDFIFIDGNHNSLYRDLLGAWTRLTNKGYILCHDINYPPVMNDINEFLRRYTASYLTVCNNPTNYGGFGLIQKCEK